MALQSNWGTLKGFVTTYALSIQWVDLGTLYYLKAFQNSFEVECYLVKDGGSDQTDFETNYKTTGNIISPATTNVQAQPPYGSKTIVVNGITHKLYSRFTGQQYPVNQGVNTLTYTVTYPWAKLIGVECVGCESLDIVNFAVYDNAQGTYSGTPNALLQQFAYSLNLPAGFYQRMAQFDADIYQGMVIEIAYTSKSAKTVGINFLIDQVV